MGKREVRISVRVTKELKDAIESEAARQRRSVTDTIFLLLLDSLPASGPATT